MFVSIIHLQPCTNNGSFTTIEVFYNNVKSKYSNKKSFKFKSINKEKKFFTAFKTFQQPTTLDSCNKMPLVVHNHEKLGSLSVSYTYTLVQLMGVLLIQRYSTTT